MDQNKSIIDLETANARIEALVTKAPAYQKLALKGYKIASPDGGCKHHGTLSVLLNSSSREEGRFLCISTRYAKKDCQDVMIHAEEDLCVSSGLVGFRYVNGLRSALHLNTLLNFLEGVPKEMLEVADD